MVVNVPDVLDILILPGAGLAVLAMCLLMAPPRKPRAARVRRRRPWRRTGRYWCREFPLRVITGRRLKPLDRRARRRPWSARRIARVEMDCGLTERSAVQPAPSPPNCPCCETPRRRCGGHCSQEQVGRARAYHASQRREPGAFGTLLTMRGERLAAERGDLLMEIYLRGIPEWMSPEEELRGHAEFAAGQSARLAALRESAERLNVPPPVPSRPPPRGQPPDDYDG